MFKVAVLLPCFNEEAAIRETVIAFRSAVPEAVIYVYDNNSSDATSDVARVAGAIVRSERLQGKGHVVRRMFGDIEADIYVMADGDATYDARAAPELIRRLVDEQLDMVVGCRSSEVELAFRPGHRMGNYLFTRLLAVTFGSSFSDVFSGYRVFSRRFVKSFPALASGFETETEISVHALALRMPVGELITAYAARPEGSFSKLSTYRDGWRIINTIVRLVRTERPLMFYGVFAFGLGACASLLSVPLVMTYLETGLVPRLPTAVLVTGMMLMAALCFVAGLILDTVVHGRREVRRLFYLGLPSVGSVELEAAPGTNARTYNAQQRAQSKVSAG